VQSAQGFLFRDIHRRQSGDKEKMSREKKTQIIDSLQEAFSGCSIGILTDYRGLTTPEMTALRRRLQESGGEYRVVKNTLARFAAARVGKDALVSSFDGPIDIFFVIGSPESFPFPTRSKWQSMVYREC